MQTADLLLRNTPLYPLRFDPLYKDYIWGGNRFRTLFHRQIPVESDRLAESWEISDHPNGRSVVRNGPLSGILLGDIVQARPKDLFGAGHFDPLSPPKRFPLILKYLDAKQFLSVQVHPDDRLAREMFLEDPGKTEVWVIVDARPDSFLWLGTNRELYREELETVIRQENLESVLNRIPVRVGDCFYLPPGTLHALGEGILVAEVQTSSDTTFRVFDWNRVDRNGIPRELKIDAAVQALREHSTPVLPQVSLFPATSNLERLVVDEHFTVNRWTLEKPTFWKSDGRCHLWTVLEGTVDTIFIAGRRGTSKHISGRDKDPDAIETFHQGDSLLIPAMCSGLSWIPENKERAVLLDIVVEKAAL